MMVATNHSVARCVVHEYNEIDPRKVFESLQTALEDIPVYSRQIDDYVTRRS